MILVQVYTTSTPPRVPTKQEMLALLQKAKTELPQGQLWVDPDCELKTRHWDETKKALIEMVAAAKSIREEIVAV